MAQYKIIGVEHMKGTSKKTGKPYDMDILHVADLSPARGKEVVGNLTDKITISRDSGILTHAPQPGEIYDIGFTRYGFVDYCDRVK